MVSHVSMEVAKTVLEVADVAWTAVETCHHHHHHHHHHPPTEAQVPVIKEGGETDLETLRSENERLRQLLEKNLNILQEISNSPALLQNCPSDLHDRLLNAVDSERFLNELESLREKSTCKFPFDDPSVADLEKAEVLINVDQEEPSWWVWVSDETAASNVEEKSGIDNENYLIVTEEHVVDGVANFMARCILANPKAQYLNPLELQKGRIWYSLSIALGCMRPDLEQNYYEYGYLKTTAYLPLMKALGGINKVEKMLSIWHAGKIFYTLATWGLALASLYQGRAILKLATLGVHHSTKLALKAL